MYVNKLQSVPLLMLLTVPLIKTLTSCHTFWEHIYNQSCMSDCLFTKWRSQVQPTFTALLFVMFDLKICFNTRIQYIYNEHNKYCKLQCKIKYMYLSSGENSNKHGQYFHEYCINKH